MLPILAFFSACSNHKAGDEQKAYALFLEAINHNAAGDKKTAITLIDSALQMNAADTTRSWLTSEKMTAYTDLGKMREAIEIGKKGIPFAEKIEDYDGMLAMCGAMGICYRRIGELDSSLIYYKKGIQKAIKSENAEYEIYKQFRELMEGRTSILIAHRFSTVKLADEILVLQDGKIIEKGNHTELIKLDGEYAKLYSMQAEAYREE